MMFGNFRDPGTRFRDPGAHFQDFGIGLRLADISGSFNHLDRCFAGRCLPHFGFLWRHFHFNLGAFGSTPFQHYAF